VSLKNQRQLAAHALLAIDPIKSGAHKDRLRTFNITSCDSNKTGVESSLYTLLMNFALDNKA
jgi:hypothetical protein